MLVHLALSELDRTTPIWNKNYKVFGKLDREERLLWWDYARDMAEKGLPMYRTLLLKVIELRMRK